MPISAISGTGTGDLLDVICSGLNKVEVPFHFIIGKIDFVYNTCFGIILKKFCARIFNDI